MGQQKVNNLIGVWKRKIPTHTPVDQPHFTEGGQKISQPRGNN